MNLVQQFTHLKSDLDKYYDTDFPSEEADSRENRRLKHKLSELIASAHAAGDADVRQGALDLLASSTGCAEDYAILVDIGEDLTSRAVITPAELKQLFDDAPTDRWE